MPIINPGVAANVDTIAQVGYVAYFAPDAAGAPSNAFIDFGELFAAGDVETVYDAQEDKILGRRDQGEYTAKTKTSSVELGFNFSTLQGFDEVLIALNRGSAQATNTGTAGVKAVSVTPSTIPGRFIMCEFGDAGTDTVIVTYHPGSRLKGAGTGSNNDQRTLQFEERAEPAADRPLPAGYAPAAVDVTRGVSYILGRAELPGLLDALGVTAA